MVDTQTNFFYILSLDGGGSLGVYTLGILKKVEELLGEPLCEKFDLIYGTSTGSIIGSLLALGKNVNEISEIYLKYIPDIMFSKNKYKRSEILQKCAVSDGIFGNKKFNNDTFKTLVGVIATYSEFPRPMIFKSSTSLFQGGKGLPGFGCTISDAVIASCSAFPFFARHTISTGDIKGIELLDGGFVANNPTLFAITDAVKALKKSEQNIRVLNIGVGNYPPSNTSFGETILKSIKPTSLALEIFRDTLEASSNTIDGLRKILFPHVSVVRVSDHTTKPDYSTNLLESNREKLIKIQNFGSSKSFQDHRDEIQKLLTLSSDS